MGRSGVAQEFCRNGGAVRGVAGCGKYEFGDETGHVQKHSERPAVVDVTADVGIEDNMFLHENSFRFRYYILFRHGMQCPVCSEMENKTAQNATESVFRGKRRFYQKIQFIRGFLHLNSGNGVYINKSAKLCKDKTENGYESCQSRTVGYRKSRA